MQLSGKAVAGDDDARQLFNLGDLHIRRGLADDHDARQLDDGLRGGVGAANSEQQRGDSGLDQGGWLAHDELRGVQVLGGPELLNCGFDELSFGVQAHQTQPLATDRQDDGLDGKQGRSGVGPAAHACAKSAVSREALNEVNKSSQRDGKNNTTRKWGGSGTLTVDAKPSSRTKPSVKRTWLPECKSRWARNQDHLALRLRRGFARAQGLGRIRGE